MQLLLLVIIRHHLLLRLLGHRVLADGRAGVLARELGDDLGLLVAADEVAQGLSAAAGELLARPPEACVRWDLFRGVLVAGCVCKGGVIRVIVDMVIRKGFAIWPKMLGGTAKQRRMKNCSLNLGGAGGWCRRK